MKHPAAAAAALLAFTLAACGAQSPAENSAEALENAAAQSTPEAAAILENAADEVREGESTAPPGAPGSPVQKAMEKAGAAQSEPRTKIAPVPPATGAKPHAKGDPVPPPQVPAEHNGH